MNLKIKIKYSTIILAILTTFSLASCSSPSTQKKPQVVWRKGKIIIAGHVNKTKNDPAVISLRGGSILFREQHVIIDSNGNFEFKFNAFIREKLSLDYFNGTAVLIAGPSDSLFVRLKASDFKKADFPDYEISGPTAKLSKTFSQFYNLFIPFMDNLMDNQSFIKLPVKEFLDTLSYKINHVDSLIQIIVQRNHPPKSFFTMAHNEGLYSIATLLIDYRIYRQWHHIPYKYYPNLYDTKLFPVDNDQAVLFHMYDLYINQYAQYCYLDGDSTVFKLWKEKKETEAFALALQNILKNEKPGLSRDIMYYELLKTRERNPKTFFALMDRKDIYKGNPELFELLEKDKQQMENPDNAIVRLNNFSKKELHLTGNFFPGLLKKYSGNVIYIDFWEVGCGPCLYEFSFAQKLHNEFKEKPVAFVNVCMNSSITQWKQLVKDLKITGDNYFLNRDQSEIIRNKLHIPSFPTFFLIDKNGNIVNTLPPRPSSGKKLTKLLDKYIKI